MPFTLILKKHLIKSHTSFYYNVNPTVINWIKSFLCFIKQRVKLNGFFSEWNDVISGIPQGTMLGPITHSHGSARVF